MVFDPGPQLISDYIADINRLIISLNQSNSSSIPLVIKPQGASEMLAVLNQTVQALNNAGGSIPLFSGPQDTSAFLSLLNALNILAPLGGGPFGPKSLPNLSLWLSGSSAFSDAGITPAVNGGSVQQMTDLSGNGKHFTNTGATKPTLNATSLNGLPAVASNATQFLTGAFGFSDDYFTAFIVAKQTVRRDFATFMAEYSGATTGFLSLACGTVAANSPFGLGKTGIVFGASNSFCAANTFSIACWKSVGTPNAHQIDVQQGNKGLIEALIKQNGVYSTGPGAGNAGYPMASPGTTSLFSSTGGTGDFLNGEIAEIIVYNRLLSNYETVRIESWLAAKYAIATTVRPKYMAEAFDGWVTPANPILTPGAAGQFDSNALTGPSVTFDGGTYYMAYVGKDVSNVNAIGLASGASPTSLTKFGKILGKSLSGWDSAYVSGDRLYKNPVDNQWYLAYFGGNAPGFEQPPASIGIAGPSATPFGPWTNVAAPVLAPGASGAWDDQILFRPYIFYNPTNLTHYLFYNARKASDSTERIGYATSTTGVLGPYTKFAGNPVLIPTVNAGDAQIVGDPVIIQPDPAVAHWVMFYFGEASPSIGEFFLAESSDLTTWTKALGGNYLRNPGLPNGIRIDVIKVNGVYEGFLDNGTNLYHASLNYG